MRKIFLLLLFLLGVVFGGVSAKPVSAIGGCVTHYYSPSTYACYGGDVCNSSCELGRENCCSGATFDCSYQTCPTACHSDSGYCGTSYCPSNAPAAQSCPSSCHTNTVYVSNGSCGSTACGPNAPAAQSCPTACGQPASTVPNGNCGTTSCPATASCCTPGTCGSTNNCGNPGASCGLFTCSNGCSGTLSCDLGTCGGVTPSTGPGAVMYGANVYTGKDNEFNVDKISSKKWKVNTTQNAMAGKYTYDYFAAWLGPKTTALNGNINASQTIDSLATAAKNFYLTAGDLAVDAAQAINTDKAVVILVNGDLNINALSRRNNKKMFLGFIVKGNINVASALANGTNPVLDGFYFANGAINIPGAGAKADLQFIGNGMFVARGGFNMTRFLGYGPTQNQTKPAEWFIFDPSLVINAPAEIMRANYTWKEVTP